MGRALTETLTTENGDVKPQWRPKYEIQGDFDLVFKEPRLSDAGKYECRSNSESTENLRHSAQVIISGKRFMQYGVIRCKNKLIRTFSTMVRALSCK